MYFPPFNLIYSSTTDSTKKKPREKRNHTITNVKLLLKPQDYTRLTQKKKQKKKLDGNKRIL